MQLFKIFQIMLMAVTWNNIEVDVPVHSSIDHYIVIPQAELYVDGNILYDDQMYYVYDAVDNNFRGDIETNYLGRVRYMIKVVFPTYHVESKQEIIFNIIDNIKPTIIKVPTFQIQLGQAIPNLKDGFEYKDNYYLKEELIVNILGLDLVDNKKVRRYQFTYQVIDPSNNISTATSYIDVVDLMPPDITKLKDVKIEVCNDLNLNLFYQFKDNSNEHISVILDDKNVSYNQVGTYTFTITAKDMSGNTTTLTDLVEIVHTLPPEIILFEQVLTIEVGAFDYEEKIRNNIKNVFDKIDTLTPEDVLVTHLIDINKVDKYSLEYKVKNSFNTEFSKNIMVHIVDTTKPTITLLSDLILPYGTTNFIPQNHFKIEDNYDDYSDLNISYNYKIDFKSLGEYSIRIEAVDRSKNKAVFEGGIRIVDLEPPVFSTLINHIKVKVFSTYNFNNFIITDNYDANPKLNITSQYFNEIGSFEVILIATDSSGNSTEKIIIIDVFDDEAPLINLSTNEIKLSIGASKINPLEYILDVSDNYDLLEIYDVIIIDTIDYNKLGIYELIYFLSDKSGNETYKVIEVKIDDTSKPIIIANNTSIKINSKFNIWSGVVVTDNDPNLKLLAYPYEIDTTKLGTYHITYIAIDSRGNMSKLTRQIEIVDRSINIKNYLYIGINFILISILTSFTYIYFEKKKRK